ncbi:galactose-binding domain-containing protein [Phytohabitans rumicis]|nr:discoidin domain-containing protein [Phytohabitans rumicis]
MIVVGGSLWPGSPASAAGTDRYVDCSATTNGTGTQTSPWNALSTVSAQTFAPGDRVLFKRGTTCNGRVTLHGSGTAGSPIVADAYGTGALPRLVGDGTWSTITVYNEEYWEFHRLEITNSGTPITESDPALIPESNRRRGIYIELHDYGVGDHYQFTNLYIHDVNGPRGYDNTTTGGIFLHVTGTSTPTRFNDILVADNTFERTDYFAVTHWTTWRHRTELPGNTSGSPYATGTWQPATNFVIRNNSLADLGADGIHTHHSVGAIMEHNVVNGHTTRDVNRCHVPIYNWNADDALIQFNEVYGGMGTCDSTAFDFDGGNIRATLQYNYSHNNKGGFLTICEAGTSRDNVVRYNISQNDGDELFSLVCGTEDNTQIYNNTFYLRNPAYTPVRIVNNTNSSGAGHAKFYNNIFYVDPTLTTSQVTYSGATGLTWNANTFYGLHPSGEPTGTNKSTANPNFTSPGTGPNGYQLTAGSPALQSGIVVAGNGGRDYWGNAVPTSCAPDRGAHQYTTTPTNCNLAVLKTATQSSTHVSGASASRAVDGNTNGAWTGGSVTHTSDSPLDTNPWWQVDLGASRSVSTIKLSNRTDCCADRLRLFYVFTSNSAFTSTNPTTTAGQAGVWNFYQAAAVGTSQTITVNQSARYIRVQLVGSDRPLSLAEVEVFGS